MATVLYEEGYSNVTAVWWIEFCGNSSPYSAFWVSKIKVVINSFLYLIG